MLWGTAANLRRIARYVLQTVLSCKPMAKESIGMKEIGIKEIGMTSENECNPVGQPIKQLMKKLST